MTGPISRNRSIGSLKEAASWPGADRNTVVTLATALVAARADAEGSRYFQDLPERNPADATAQALAGFFQVRAGQEVAAALTRLDQAATMDLGLPQYFRGLALAELLLGRQQQAAEALRRPGLDPAATDRPPTFTSFPVTARDGMRLSAPGALNPAPDVIVGSVPETPLGHLSMLKLPGDDGVRDLLASFRENRDDGTRVKTSS